MPVTTDPVLAAVEQTVDRPTALRILRGLAAAGYVPAPIEDAPWPVLVRAVDTDAALVALILPEWATEPDQFLQQVGFPSALVVACRDVATLDESAMQAAGWVRRSRLEAEQATRAAFQSALDSIEPREQATT